MSAYDVETLPSPSSCHPNSILPANEVGCVTMATVTSAGSRLVLPDAGVTLMIPEGALKAGQVQEHYLAILREDRFRPKISGIKSFKKVFWVCVSYGLWLISAISSTRNANITESHHGVRSVGCGL